MQHLFGIYSRHKSEGYMAQHNSQLLVIKWNFRQIEISNYPVYLNKTSGENDSVTNLFVLFYCDEVHAVNGSFQVRREIAIESVDFGLCEMISSFPTNIIIPWKVNSLL